MQYNNTYNKYGTIPLHIAWPIQKNCFTNLCSTSTIVSLFLQFNPADEEEGYLNCCVYSTDTCKEFYTVRPVNNGQFYTPPIISMSHLWRTYIHYID